MEIEFVYKVIIIGSTGVGKTCILTSLTEGRFSDEHNATIGVEFGQHAINLDENTHIKMQIWDTAGQESYRAITRNFYRNASGVLLVFDVTSRSSFDGLQDWLNEINNHGNPDAVILLVGNQIDSVENDGVARETSREEALKFVEDNKLHNYIETSAKTSKNITDAFIGLAKEINKDADIHKERHKSSTSSIGVDVISRRTQSHQKPKKSCC